MLHNDYLMIMVSKKPYKIIFLGTLGILLAWLFGFSFTIPLVDASPKALHHDLKVGLYPADNKLTGKDDIRIRPDKRAFVIFNLSKRVRIMNAAVNGTASPYSFEGGLLRISLGQQAELDEVSVSIIYEGYYEDPTPIQPLNMDNPGFGVSGIISEKGCFLQSDSGWYPRMPGSQPKFDIAIAAPEGVLAVTEGKSRGHHTKNGKTISIWSIDHPTEGLSLSAAPYVLHTKKAGDITAMTYLFSESSGLADTYLDATLEYISFYENLIGPYPFSKFAVVENFFPTGYGFPSYTLLGSTVIRLPFIVRTSLGHEIAHCWWGNGVFPDYEKGNWSEALTTYVADYLYKERQSAEKAMEYRLKVLRSFSTLVGPERDFPLANFRMRYDKPSQAIGYGKGAMVFHMIRKLLGEETFWAALRDIYKDRLFKLTSWEDFRKAFERHAQRPLQKFFRQWVYGKGGPQLVLEGINVERTGEIWKIDGKVVQERPFYDLNLDLAVKTKTQELTETLAISGKTTPFQITTKARPMKMSLDPNFDTFRILYPSEIPPSINSLKASRSLIVVIGERAWPGMTDIAKTLMASFGVRNAKIVQENDLENRMILDNHIIYLGIPSKGSGHLKLPSGVEISDTGFLVNGNYYDKPSDAFFGVFRHPQSEDRVMALFVTRSPDQARVVVRKITHYGSYSYLVFRDGRNVAKGISSVEKSPLIHNWDEQ